MDADDRARLRDVLDRMGREKEITATFFARVAECLGDVEQRRWFRRMAQDEKDQRKILLKHRRELCGGLGGREAVRISPLHELLQQVTRAGDSDYYKALQLAVRSAEQAREFCERASNLVRDRSCRIFLKILSEESVKHRQRLVTELRQVERARAQEEVAA